MFLNVRQEMVSLECVFYMTDCHYNSLKKRDNGRKVDRIGSENYALADIGHTNFDQEPTCLDIDKSDSYLGKKKAKTTYKQSPLGEIKEEFSEFINSKNTKRDAQKSETLNVEISKIQEPPA